LPLFAPRNRGAVEWKRPPAPARDDARAL
jgi:hypothetical protein